MSEGKELAKYEDIYKAEVAALEGAAGTVYDIKPQIIEIVHSSQLFKMPDESTESRLRVIILGAVKFRSFFEGSGDESLQMCQSLGGKVGSPTPEGKEKYAWLNATGPLCEPCMANIWGSGKEGRGKLCKSKRNVLIFEPRWNTALLLRVPVTSVDNHDQLWSQAKAKQKPMSGFWTEISLQKQSSGERVWSTIRFEMSDNAEKDEFMGAIALRNQFQQWISHIEEEPQDFSAKPKSPVYSEAELVEPVPEGDDKDDDLPF